jgi:bifunctional DNase/RNase
MIETIVESISINLVTRNRVVFLKEVHGARHLPIWIGDFEAHAIAMELQGAPSPRPMPYDLIKTMIAELNAVIDRVVISDLAHDVFYARIMIEAGGRMVEIDSRPSDAIAVAVRAKCPIYVAEQVMDRAGVSPDEEVDDEPEELAEPAATEARPSGDELGIFRDFINTLDLDDFEKRGGRSAPHGEE